ACFLFPRSVRMNPQQATDKDVDVPASMQDTATDFSRMTQRVVGISPSTSSPSLPPPSRPAAPRRRRWRWALLAVIGLMAAIAIGGPVVRWGYRLFVTVSTDDAFVTSHSTQVAARVPGQVRRILVDNNDRVHVGDLLIELDTEPYQVQVEI